MTWDRGGRSLAATNPRLHRRILRRDPTCQVCWDAPSDEVDHKLNRESGGTDHPTNLQGICQPCHKAKTQDEARAARARLSRKRPEPAHPGLVTGADRVPEGGG